MNKILSWELFQSWLRGAVKHNVDFLQQSSTDQSMKDEALSTSLAVSSAQWRKQSILRSMAVSLFYSKKATKEILNMSQKRWKLLPWIKNYLVFQTAKDEGI